MGQIYGYYDEAQQEQDRLAKQAQLNQALQAFSGFIQKNREQKMQAPLIQAQTVDAQAQALMNRMKAQQAMQFLQRKQGGMQPQIQPPSGMGQPSLNIPFSPQGGIKTLSPQELMRQNAMNGVTPQMQQQPTMNQTSQRYADPLGSLSAQIEDEYDPIQGDYTTRGKLLLEKYKSELKKSEKGELPASLQKAKDARTENLILTAEKLPMEIDYINQAKSFLKELPLQGRAGMIDIKRMQEVDPQNEILGKWQILKGVLTEATLDYVSKTKGAVSDKETMLFLQSVGNDDLISVARLTPVLDKILKSKIVGAKAQSETYKKLYGEDPSGFVDLSFIDNAASGGSGDDFSNMSDDELRKIASGS